MNNTFFQTPFSRCDAYKLSHWRQFPEDVNYIYSNFTPRYTLLGDDVKHVVVFGIRAFCYKLIDTFEQRFFSLDANTAISDYAQFFTAFMGVSPHEDDIQRVSDLWKLRTLPLEIHCVPEGSFVPHGVPVLTIENTVPGFHWLVGWVESWMSSELWHPMTSATTASMYRIQFDKYANLTSEQDFMPKFQGHDFSFRGQTCLEAATVSGAAHALFFTGSDTCPSLSWIMDNYNESMSELPKELIITSVVATEHSVMAAGGELSEIDTISRLLDLHPTGILSVVSDTWDFWGVVTEILPQLKDRIMTRDGKYVVRPDCYDDITQILTTSGWKFFSDLTDTDQVAQVHENGMMSFVIPEKIIRQHYNGKMVTFTDGLGRVDLCVTPEHTMVWDKPKKGLTTESANVSKVNQTNKRLLRSAATILTETSELSAIDKLKIAFQADGSFPSKKSLTHPSGYVTIRFTFTKQRKMDRLEEICQEAGLVFKASEEPSRQNQKVYYVQVPVDVVMSKTFDWVGNDLSTISSTWACAFIEELSYWDATRRSETRFKFDTTNKDVIEVVEKLALLAGYGCYRTQTSDGRSEKYKDVYTANILKDNRISSQSIKKAFKDYEGMVYCVRVPTGKIVVKRNAATAVSGNSGDPVKIICGDPEAEVGTPEYYGLIEVLGNIFGYTVNSKGYKQLDSHIGAIYGDSITLARQKEILKRLEDEGWSSTNIVLGIGSFTYQYVIRDTHGFAMKATAVGKTDGTYMPIFKAPKTDSGKNSAKGFLSVYMDPNECTWKCQQNVPFEQRHGQMGCILRDGEVLEEETFEDIRKRAEIWLADAVDEA